MNRVLAAAAELARQLRHLRRDWRHARTIIEASALTDEPVPYWPADGLDAIATAVTCTRCRDRISLPPCTCTIDCGHPTCTGDRPTIHANWTPAELAALRGETELPR